MKFFDELKSRNVIKATIAYIVVAWVLLQVFSIVLPNFEAPSWVFKSLTFIIVIGLPIWMIFSWVYEVTPEGLKKTVQVTKENSISSSTNRRLNIIIIIALIIAIGVSLVNILMFNISSKNIKNNDLKLNKSIAVLPFRNMSSDKNNDWFGDGVTEDILTNLSKIKGLRVISRTSVNQYKNSGKSIPEIAKELGVSYVVEGSVRRRNNKVLITAQLIKDNDEHIWGESYNEVLEDAFEIQRTVSKKIVQQLEINISPEEEKALNLSPTNNMEAYQLYIKGRTFADTRTKESLEMSIDFYKQAIALDPNYAEAYAEIANSNFLLVEYADEPLNEATLESKRWIEKALAINTKSVRAYSTLGFIATNNKNWETAQKNFDKAIMLNPNDATSRHHYAIYLKEKPEPDIKKALAQISEAQRLDPFSKPITSNHIYALIGNEYFNEAEDLLSHKGFLLSSDQVLNHLIIIKVNLNKDWTESINIISKAILKDPNNATLHLKLARDYNDILNDETSYLSHAKKSYEIDEEIGAYDYLNALVLNKNYAIAKDLLNSQDFIKLYSEDEVEVAKLMYNYFKGDYKESLDICYKLSDNNLAKFSYMARLFALLKDEKSANYILNNNSLTNECKTIVFAILKEPDSMYYYLNSFNLIEAKNINKSREFKPYRNEPRFKAFQKKNYLPVTNKLD